MACITISGKYCKWMLEPDKHGEELEVYIIFIRNVQTFHVAVPFCIFISNIWKFYFIYYSRPVYTTESEASNNV